MIMPLNRMQYYIYVALPARLSRRVAAIRQNVSGDIPLRPTPHARHPAHDRSGQKRARTGALAARRHRHAGTVQKSDTRASSFFGSKDFVYVPVHKTPLLRACREACVRAVRGILEERRLDRFRHPHITLAGRLPPAGRIAGVAGARGQNVRRAVSVQGGVADEDERHRHAVATRVQVASRRPLTTSGLSSLNQYRLPGGAARLAVLLRRTSQPPRPTPCAQGGVGRH